MWFLVNIVIFRDSLSYWTHLITSLSGFEIGFGQRSTMSTILRGIMLAMTEMKSDYIDAQPR